MLLNSKNQLLLQLFIGALISIAPAALDRTTITEDSERTYIRSYPFVVIIQHIYVPGANRCHCTGVILSEKWLASSATCFHQICSHKNRYVHPPSFMYRIIAGSTISQPETGLLVFPMGIYYHPEYKNNERTYDVAILQISFPFKKNEFSNGRVTSIPVASTDGRYIAAGLSKLINIQPICTIVGWANTPSPGAEHQLALYVQILKNETECGQFICDKLRALCQWPPRILGLICARALQWAPCDGFLGAPVICGTNVWATVSDVEPCTEENYKTVVLLTKLDVGFDFMKRKMSGASTRYTQALLALPIMAFVA